MASYKFSGHVGSLARAVFGEYVPFSDFGFETNILGSQFGGVVSIPMKMSSSSNVYKLVVILQNVSKSTNLLGRFPFGK